MRTPVASKNAFATAAPIGAVGGSPAPVTAQVALVAEMFPACTFVPPPGVLMTYPSGFTIAIVTFGASLIRRIGYVTQSVLVIRSFVKESRSYSARERPWIAAPSAWFATRSGFADTPFVWAT